MRLNDVKARTSDEKIRIRHMDIKITPMDELQREPDIDIDNEKALDKFIKTLKTKIRGTMEYRELMSFIKNNMDMDRCFYLPRVRQRKGSMVKIEQHHSNLTMTEIIESVILKRVKCGESLRAQYIAKEVMEAHYRGMISLVPLSSTMHALIHADDSELFIPIQDSTFGDSRLFYDEYSDYMSPKTKKNFEKMIVMSEAVENIDDIIPDTLDVSFIYYNEDGIDIPDMGKILEVLDAA